MVGGKESSFSLAMERSAIKGVGDAGALEDDCEECSDGVLRASGAVNDAKSLNGIVPGAQPIRPLCLRHNHIINQMMPTRTATPERTEGIMIIS